jgi:selenophosphate synthase
MTLLLTTCECCCGALCRLQNIWTNVDKLMTHDVCGPGTFGIFQKEFGENAQVR